jgi:hypothetical protein
VAVEHAISPDKAQDLCALFEHGAYCAMVSSILFALFVSRIHAAYDLDILVSVWVSTMLLSPPLCRTPVLG